MCQFWRKPQQCRTLPWSTHDADGVPIFCKMYWKRSFNCEIFTADSRAYFFLMKNISCLNSFTCVLWPYLYHFSFFKYLRKFWHTPLKMPITRCRVMSCHIVSCHVMSWKRSNLRQNVCSYWFCLQHRDVPLTFPTIALCNMYD